MVVPLATNDSLSSVGEESHRASVRVSSLSQSTLVMSGIVRPGRRTLFLRVIPVTALTIGRALRTVLPKLRRLDLNRRIRAVFLVACNRVYARGKRW